MLCQRKPRWTCTEEAFCSLVAPHSWFLPYAPFLWSWSHTTMRCHSTVPRTACWPLFSPRLSSNHIETDFLLCWVLRKRKKCPRAQHSRPSSAQMYALKINRPHPSSGPRSPQDIHSHTFKMSQWFLCIWQIPPKTWWGSEQFPAGNSAFLWVPSNTDLYVSVSLTYYLVFNLAIKFLYTRYCVLQIHR